MSSSNLVEVTYVKESAYGEKPADLSLTTLYTARFTSESLSGTPDTTESVELRTDRMSAGQVVTGLTVGGDIEFELSADKFHDDFLMGAMMNAYVPAETVNTTVDLVPDPGDDQKATLTLGSSFANLVPGVLVAFKPAANTDNGVVVQITSVDTPSTVFTVATKRGEAAVTGETLDVIIPAYLDIGLDQVSFVIGKAYTDVLHLQTTDEHSQTYTGSLVSGFTVNAEYGSIITGSYTTSGNGYEQEAPSFSQQVETAGGTVTPAGTTNPLNASVDVPLVTVDNVASTWCTETFSVSLDNGLSEQTCIGKAAPTGYTLGTAAISVEMSAYLSDTAYDATMVKKLTQEPASITYVTQNADGGYGFVVTAVQFTFPDPAATGQNEDAMIEASGVGKVGANGESAIRIYKLGKLA